MLDPAGKSLYLQAWWYRGWSGLGPSARFHCPLSLPFKMHQVTMLCPPHNLGTERGAWVLCVATLTKTDRGSARIGALATSVWAAPPCSDASSAPFQIQSWILDPVLKRSRQSSWAVRCFCPMQETESAAGAHCVCVVSHASFLGGKC